MKIEIYRPESRKNEAGNNEIRNGYNKKILSFRLIGGIGILDIHPENAWSRYANYQKNRQNDQAAQAKAEYRCYPGGSRIIFLNHI